jgi:hypothetical protein
MRLARRVQAKINSKGKHLRLAAEKVEKLNAETLRKKENAKFVPSVKLVLTPHQRIVQYQIDKEVEAERASIISSLLEDISLNKELGSKGLSVTSLVRLANESLPSNVKEISLESVYKWSRNGLLAPPPHEGRMIPLEVYSTLASFMESEQRNSEPVTPARLKEVISSLVAEVGFSTDYIYAELRKKHPEVMDYITGDNADFRRAEWLTYTNASKWTKDYCAELVRRGFGVYEDFTDEDGLEYTVRIHEWAKPRIINADETQIEMSNAPEKGGSRATKLGSRGGQNPKENIVNGSGHTTAMMTCAADGSCLPLMIINSSDSVDSASIDLLGIEGLPKMKNAAGVEQPNLFASTPKGSMDVTRFGDYCDHVMKFFGDTLSPDWEFSETGEVLKGPIMLVVDSGPGRFADSDENFEIRERTLKRGMSIYACLPNATAAMQLMDALFGYFKQLLRMNMQRLVLEQLLARDKARQSGSGSITKIELGRRHLGKLLTGVGITNGTAPFQDAFTVERVLAGVKKTGLDGSDGWKRSSRIIDDREDAKNDAWQLNTKHNASLKFLSDLKVGFNTSALIVALPPKAVNFVVPQDKDLLIKAMLENGSIYKAGTIFKWLNSMSVNDGVIMEVHRKARDDKKQALKEKGEKKAGEVEKKERLGMDVFNKFKLFPKLKAEASHTAGEAETLCRFILTTEGHTTKLLSDYKGKNQTRPFLEEMDWRVLFDPNFDEAKVAAEHAVAAVVPVVAAPVQVEAVPVQIQRQVVPQGARVPRQAPPQVQAARKRRAETTAIDDEREARYGKSGSRSRGRRGGQE